MLISLVVPFVVEVDGLINVEVGYYVETGLSFCVINEVHGKSSDSPIFCLDYVICIVL
jgi:hypothetical protein